MLWCELKIFDHIDSFSDVLLSAIFLFVMVLVLIYSLSPRHQVLWVLALDVGSWVFSTWKLFRHELYAPAVFFFYVFINVS